MCFTNSSAYPEEGKTGLKLTHEDLSYIVCVLEDLNDANVDATGLIYGFIEAIKKIQERRRK